jgi:hypothetical protein
MFDENSPTRTSERNAIAPCHFVAPFRPLHSNLRASPPWVSAAIVVDTLDRERAVAAE